MSDIKKETVQGVKWNAIGSFSNIAITFLTGVVLARLLSPSDFGIVGMISIFFVIAQTFVDSGFGLALIRKEAISDVDCSTVFYFNLIVSLVCYVLLFLGAPFIAVFFHNEILVSLVRVSGLTLILGAFNCVQFALLVRAVDFKTQAKISLISYIIAGVSGVFLAYRGYGVWALVAQSLIQPFVSAIVVWIVSSWKPKLEYSWDSFKNMFSFGGKMLCSRLLDRFYTNINGLAIGKFYTPSDLGFYSKGSGTATLPSSFLYNIVGSVSMPILSKLQNDDEVLLKAYRKYIKVCSLIIFFLMTLLAAIAKPCVVFLYSEKWLPCVIYLQIFCFSYMFYHIHAINVNLLLAKGRSDLNLRIEIVKKVIGFSALILSLPFGVLALCASSVITSQLSMVVNTYYTGKIFNFGYLKQWADFLPYFMYSIIACIPAYCLTLVNMPTLLLIILGTLVSSVLYFGFLFMKGDENLRELIMLTPLRKYFK